ncbi:MAG: hypothetical protein M1829_005229 [Trizodia sp. TS-e1964]|nr:MAG: hypothetical protein M1829_005229 [Trizodia sp. TS-e1964]
MSMIDSYSSYTEPITVKPQVFRAHLGRHLEQIALFVLPRSELMELPDAPVQSTAAHHGDREPIEKTLLSDDSEAEHENINLTPQSESQKTIDDEPLMQLDMVNEKETIFISHNIQTELTTAPELAMGWLPPMNFTPPEKDFEAENTDCIPRREDSMFGGDLFTPGWVRGYDKEKEGFCGRCEPGVWHNIDNLSYENDLTYRHGIDSSGIPLPRPSSIRLVKGKVKTWEGYCESCQGWRILRTTMMGWNWFRHCVTEHNSEAHDLCNPTAQSDLVARIKTGNISNLLSVQRDSGHLLEFDPLMRTPLHYAAELGSIEAVQLLLKDYYSFKSSKETKAFIDSQSSRGETALMLAASQGNEAVAELLIKYGADIDALSSNGKTALDYAAEGGYQRIIQILINNNADLQKSSSYLKIRLQNKIKAQEEVLAASYQPKQLIVEKIADNVSNWTPLMVAAANGDVETIKRLLKVGADIEAASNNGETALMLGASKGHLDVVKILLGSGANIDATNGKGWTTLMVSVREKDEKTVDLLLSNGADVNHLSPDRWTALAEATFRGQTSIMALLLRCGADTESKSSHDWTPLMHAAYKGDEESVALLLAAGANLDISSLHDETAILLAAAGSHTRIVQTLLDAGCAPEPAWAVRKTVLNDQIEAGESEGVARDKASLGWTPLMLACQNGLEDVVKMLLGAGVNLEPQSPYRKTALVIAKENGRVEIVKLLEDHLAASATS